MIFRTACSNFLRRVSNIAGSSIKPELGSTPTVSYSAFKLHNPS
ncbi:hypothetical protein FDUTEX481_00089 [Tolypothrix sp. PCC 7601]|nr:hypothetical protein FDUTEX481_00089 [Tolypothrix sp. PCC 7601]